MSARRLDASYASFRMQMGAHEHAKRTALRPTAAAELLDRLGLSELIGRSGKDRRRGILERFEDLGRQIRRQGFVDLVSAFEADVFRLLGMATRRATS